MNIKTIFFINLPTEWTGQLHIERRCPKSFGHRSHVDDFRFQKWNVNFSFFVHSSFKMKKTLIEICSFFVYSVRLYCSPDMKSLLLLELPSFLRLRRDVLTNSSSFTSADQNLTSNHSQAVVPRLLGSDAEPKPSIDLKPSSETSELGDLAFSSTCRTISLPLKRLADTKFSFNVRNRFTTFV